MDSTTPDSSEDKGLTYSTQQYVAAKPSTAATQVDPRRSSHHARRSSVAELTGDNVKNEDEKKTFEEQMQTAAVDRVGVVGDAVKGSKGHISPAKTTNTAKAMSVSTAFPVSA